jgi:hypothetical protein
MLLSLIFYLFGRQTTIVVWLCSATAMVALLATLAARVKAFTALARRRRWRGPPAVAGGRIRLQAGLDA